MAAKTGNPSHDLTIDAGEASNTSTLPDHHVQSGLAMPHDRDEGVDRQGHAPEPVMVQAEKDVRRGLRDTDLRGTVGEKFDRRFGAGKSHGTP